MRRGICARIGELQRFARGIDPLPSRSLLLQIATLVGLVIVGLIALSGSPRSFAAEQQSDIPAWLKAHVGDGEGKISQVVLQRARAHYLQKLGEGAVKIPATSPWTRHAPRDLAVGST